MIRYASFGRRLWAFVLSLLLDLLVLGALSTVTGGADIAAPFAAWYAIHHVGFVVEGGTLGHRLAGLRVVRVDGERVGVVHAVMREIMRLFVSLPPLALGALWMLDHPQRRTWHDLVADTVVVRELPAGAVTAPAWADDPPWRREGPNTPAAEATDTPSGESLPNLP